MARFEVLEEYIESQRSEIEAGKPVVIEVRDLDTFERMVTRSIVSTTGGRVRRWRPPDGAQSGRKHCFRCLEDLRIGGIGSRVRR